MGGGLDAERRIVCSSGRAAVVRWLRPELNFEDKEVMGLARRWKKWLSRVSNLLVSLGHTGRRVVLGHTLNTL